MLLYGCLSAYYMCSVFLQWPTWIPWVLKVAFFPCQNKKYLWAQIHYKMQYLFTCVTCCFGVLGNRHSSTNTFNIGALYKSKHHVAGRIKTLGGPDLARLPHFGHQSSIQNHVFFYNLFYLSWFCCIYFCNWNWTDFACKNCCFSTAVVLSWRVEI